MKNLYFYICRNFGFQRFLTWMRFRSCWNYDLSRTLMILRKSWYCWNFYSDNILMLWWFLFVEDSKCWFFPYFVEIMIWDFDFAVISCFCEFWFCLKIDFVKKAILSESWSLKEFLWNCHCFELVEIQLCKNFDFLKNLILIKRYLFLKFYLDLKLRFWLCRNFDFLRRLIFSESSPYESNSIYSLSLFTCIIQQ